MPVIVRALALTILVFLCDSIVKLGTSPFVLSVATACGVLSGYQLAKSRLRIAGFALLLVLFSLLCFFCLNLLQSVAVSFFKDPLHAHSVALHAGLCLIFYLAGSVSTFLVSRSVHALSAEIIIFVFGTVYFFSSHRQFNFQSPQILGSLAWDLGISPLSLLSALGVLLLALCLAYLRLSDSLLLKKDPLNIVRDKSAEKRGISRIKSLSSVLCLIAIFFVVGNLVHSFFKTEAAQRTSMGVGQGREENQSPLGFNSALGASNQPTSLVRLEGDYQENPFVPMLYLRESALSLYNGIEMVAASAAYDQDVPSLPPDAHYRLNNQPTYDYRVPLQQSVFPLSDHKLAFGLDFPLTINPLKNPNPKRFRAAYKVYSMAPAYDIKAISAVTVGDPQWDEATRRHYTATNPDERYTRLAREITAQYSQPLEQARALTDYLSEKTIYTLSPGHDLPENRDQTAPYLFGDMRGYCVHFAHALTYLFRSLGIPARIATGYMTDLSQSRDGHILLRMSDRHAWAEVFVTNLGWVPFDPKPQNVESHAESPVDMNLLEELMDLIGPTEEILPEDLAQGEKGLQERNGLQMPDASWIIFMLAAFLVCLFLLKSYLWFCWILPVSEERKIKLLYRSLLARVIDLGLSRKAGETRQEHRQKTDQESGLDLLAITGSFNASIYGGTHNLTEAREFFRQAVCGIKKLPVRDRLFSIINTESVRRFLSGSGW